MADGVTRHLLSVFLLVPYQPVLLDPFELLPGVILCDRTRNELWGGSATAYFNNNFLWIVNFVFVDLSLLTWGVDCLSVSLSIICIV